MNHQGTRSRRAAARTLAALRNGAAILPRGVRKRARRPVRDRWAGAGSSGAGAVRGRAAAGLGESLAKPVDPTERRSSRGEHATKHGTSRQADAPAAALMVCVPNHPTKFLVST